MSSTATRKTSPPPPPDAGPASSAADLARYRANLAGEVDGAFVYGALAALEGDRPLAAIYRRLAEAELRHAELWRSRLRVAGETSEPRPSWRARLLAGLARRFGTDLVLPLLADAEERDRGMYDDQPEAKGTTLRADERSHARLLGRLAKGRGLPGSIVARVEGRHRAIGGNALRALVLGANDGLVSNLSLVMGVAGAALGGATVLVTGTAGLLAGALSMALGEWISVRSAREMHARQLAVERDELRLVPEEEELELALIYQAKGVPEADARLLASHLMRDPEVALDTMAREELGIDPDELGGSEWTAAFASFFAFALGAAIPILPFVIGSGMAVVVVSAALSATALFGLGALITVLTGQPAVRAGSRQAAIGLTAAAVTFVAGTLLGITVGG